MKHILKTSPLKIPDLHVAAEQKMEKRKKEIRDRLLLHAGTVSTAICSDCAQLP